MRVLVATQKVFSDKTLLKIRKMILDAGHEFMLFEAYEDKFKLMEILPTVEALLVRSDSVCTRVLRAGEQLLLVSKAGKGTENLRPEFAKERGIVLMNTPQFDDREQEYEAAIEATQQLLDYLSDKKIRNQVL